jgi:glycoprotein endo-alpha-1,2-mannosidase
LDDVGLKFAVVYEEYTAGIVEDQTSKTAMEAAKDDMSYLQTNYFSNDQYLKFANTPALLTFGPRFFKQPSQWTEIFASMTTKPKFLPLWNHGSFVGDNDHGEFGWVDFNTSLPALGSFYNKIPYVEILIGSAYPRFHDFYAEGNWGASYGFVDDNDGETLASTLSLANTRNASHLQLVTWNDFGEGTQIEPTVEDGFSSLVQIQAFTGVSYGIAELELIHRYYSKRKELKNLSEAQPVLNKVFECLTELDVATATELLDQL